MKRWIALLCAMLLCVLLPMSALAEARQAPCGREGHTLEDGLNHNRAKPCWIQGHRNCDGIDHDYAPCGYRSHYKCDGKAHDASSCGAPGHTVCDGDKHELASCGVEGHCVSDRLNHRTAPCGVEGHYRCDGLDHKYAECNVKGHIGCDGMDHSRAACGKARHYGCDDKDHAQAACGAEGHFVCDGAAHEAAVCGMEGHYLCDGLEHDAVLCAEREAELIEEEEPAAEAELTEEEETPAAEAELTEEEEPAAEAEPIEEEEPAAEAEPVEEEEPAAEAELTAEEEPVVQEEEKEPVDPNTDFVPTAIDTDGTLFNGLGYIDGYRLSSSGALKEAEGSAATGFIACTHGDTIQLLGAEWTEWEISEKNYVSSYVVFYDENFEMVDSYNFGGNTHGVLLEAQSAVIAASAEGATLLAFPYNSDVEFSYIRVSAKGAGADMAVTLNNQDAHTILIEEEMEEEAAAGEPETAAEEEAEEAEETAALNCTNLVPMAVDADGSLFGEDYDGDGVNDGYLAGKRVSSSGVIKDGGKGSACTGFIPVFPGDVVRIKGVVMNDGEGSASKAFAVFDSSFSWLGTTAYQTQENHYGVCAQTPPVCTVSEDVTIIVVPQDSAVAYCVISGLGQGSDMIVTVNEEIQ